MFLEYFSSECKVSRQQYVSRAVERIMHRLQEQKFIFGCLALRSRLSTLFQLKNRYYLPHPSKQEKSTANFTAHTIWKKQNYVVELRSLSMSIGTPRLAQYRITSSGDGSSSYVNSLGFMPAKNNWNASESLEYSSAGSMSSKKANKTLEKTIRTPKKCLPSTHNRSNTVAKQCLDNRFETRNRVKHFCDQFQ